jgi:hypothetical protein
MDEHREWEQAVCAEVGTEAIVPLWHRDRRAVVGELLDAGFVAVIVAVRDGVRPTSPLGRRLDAGWPRSRRPGADACGEGGEYHSFVVDGPIFRNAVEVVVGPMSLRDGVWFVDLLPARRPRTDREEGPVRPHRRSKSGRRCRQPPGASADLPLHDQRAHSAALRAAPPSRAVVEGASAVSPAGARWLLQLFREHQVLEASRCGSPSLFAKAMSLLSRALALLYENRWVLRLQLKNLRT